MVFGFKGSFGRFFLEDLDLECWILVIGGISACIN